MEKIISFKKEIKNKNAFDILQFFLQQFNNKITFASSMSVEDQVITHMLTKINPKCYIFTLDTGRLFPETYNLIERTIEAFNIPIKIFFPDAVLVQEMVNKKGINLFYESIENRKLCCEIRKLEPLKRAFTGMDAWICGLRREQSVTRSEIEPIEWDNTNNLYKINPLYNWTEKQVWDYIHKHHIPYNPLHDKGFLSIGCQPCTRAVKQGEDIRAGRWWWENPETKECGLHR